MSRRQMRALMSAKPEKGKAKELGFKATVKPPAMNVVARRPKRYDRGEFGLGKGGVKRPTSTKGRRGNG